MKDHQKRAVSFNLEYGLMRWIERRRKALNVTRTQFARDLFNEDKARHSKGVSSEVAWLCKRLTELIDLSPLEVIDQGRFQGEAARTTVKELQNTILRLYGDRVQPHDPYWVSMSNDARACVIEMTAERACLVAAKCFPGANVIGATRLPYAASPLVGEYTDMTLCHQPNVCAGRTSCPRARSCSE